LAINKKSLMNRINRFFTKNKRIALGAVVFLTVLTACEKYVIESTEIDPNEPRSFQTDILPIFAKNNCASCHGGGIPPDLRAENAYNSLTAGGYVSVSNPESSKIYKQLINNSSHQPKTTPDEEKYILYWIAQGAKNN
jgi:hypothetical protein